MQDVATHNRNSGQSGTLEDAQRHEFGPEQESKDEQRKNATYISRDQQPCWSQAAWDANALKTHENSTATGKETRRSSRGKCLTWQEKHEATLMLDSAHQKGGHRLVPQSATAAVHELQEGA